MMSEPRMLMLSKLGRPSPFFHIRAPVLVILSLTMWTCRAETDGRFSHKHFFFISLNLIFNPSPRKTQNLVSVQVYDVHLEADQRLYQRDGDVGVQVVPSALKHRMSERERNPEITRLRVTDPTFSRKPWTNTEMKLARTLILWCGIADLPVRRRCAVHLRPQVRYQKPVI